MYAGLVLSKMFMTVLDIVTSHISTHSLKPLHTWMKMQCVAIPMYIGHMLKSFDFNMLMRINLMQMYPSGNSHRMMLWENECQLHVYINYHLNLSLVSKHVKAFNIIATYKYNVNISKFRLIMSVNLCMYSVWFNMIRSTVYHIRLNLSKVQICSFGKQLVYC